MSMNKVMMSDEQMDQISGGSILPYRVQAGNSIEAIAKKYNVTVDQLKKWNNLGDTSTLAVGQQLRIKF